MIKNNEGVTLITLVVTVIVLSILIGIGIPTANTVLQDTKKDRLSIELGLVRQAIMEQYGKAFAVGKTEKTAEEERVSFWVGQKITNFSEIKLPEQDKVSFHQEIEQFYQKNQNYNCTYQEDYYYRLDPEKLSQIGIKNAVHTYIVNYKTGEVYNETKQLNGNSELLYFPPINKGAGEQNLGDTNSFNDWK